MGDVPLREYIESIIKEHERRRDDLRIEDHRRIDQAVKSLTERFEISVNDVDNAREKQAKENERRLEELNHAHAEAQRVLHTYVTQSVYEKDRDAFAELKQRVDVELAARTGSSRGFDLFFKISSGLSLIIGLTLAFLTYGK